MRQDSTYTATAALLKLLPKGQRAGIRETAGVGEETCGGCAAASLSAARPPRRWPIPPGCPVSKAFTEKVRAGGKLGGNTQPHYHRFLSSVFEKAVKWQLIDENPPVGAQKLPRRQKSKWKHCRKRTLPKLLEAPAGRASTVQRYHTAGLCSQVPAGFIRSTAMRRQRTPTTDVFSRIKEKVPRQQKTVTWGVSAAPREPSAFCFFSWCPFYGMMCPLESALKKCLVLQKQRETNVHVEK